MPIQISKSKDGLFTISLGYGAPGFETSDPVQMLGVVAHYCGVAHQAPLCPLCVPPTTSERTCNENLPGGTL